MGSVRALMLAAREPRAEAVGRALAARGFELEWVPPDRFELGDQEPVASARAVYLPGVEARPALGPDLREAERAFAHCAARGVGQLVLVSSAEVYGASPRNPGFMSESRPPPRDAKNAIARSFLELETLARARVAAPATLTILRACPWPVRDSRDYFSRLFGNPAAITLAGHDPSLQLLHPSDLAQAIALVLERGRSGVFNVAPDGSIPLRKALARSAQLRLPVLRSVQSAARELLARFAPEIATDPIDQLEFIRYSFTISNQKLRSELGFLPEHSSEQALAAFSAHATHEIAGAYDDFGLDREYVERAGRYLFDFMANRYWRIAVDGLEHVPLHGKAVLAGLHRGLVAWDAVMIMHILAQKLGRHPRFLVHPTAFQFPFVFDLTTKLGGVVACQENADYVLEHGELLGIFPEGIRGVFSLYKDAYRLRKFGRHDFVRIALRNQSPIVPFVIVGSAEAYPIFGKVDWRWLRRKTEWPFFPLTPTLFPLMPAPLPSKWYLRFLPPVDLAGHPPEAAKDSLLVRTISDGIKRDMQAAIDELLAKRRSLFAG